MLTRDINRRVNVIQNKIKDLQEMGVPCVFAYATTWTGGLYVCGDERMTREVKASSNKILDNLKVEEVRQGSNFCLPHLPEKLSKLNSKTVTAMLVGIGKDLKIDWKGEKPSWWPELVPFQHPRNPAPDELKGNFF